MQALFFKSENTFNCQFCHFYCIGPLGQCFQNVRLCVRLSVCLSVRLFTFVVPFKPFFLPALLEVGCPKYL